MAITFIKGKKSQQYLLLVLVFLLLVFGGVVLYGKFRSDPVLFLGLDVPVATPPIRIKLELFTHKLLQELSNPPAPVSFPENVGKPNPFVP